MMKSSLSAAGRELVERMQAINFGRIENLAVRHGEPIFNQLTMIVRDIKIGGENGPRSELSKEDFVLKEQVAELFEHLTRLADGSLATIHVQHGLPCRLMIQQPA